MNKFLIAIALGLIPLIVAKQRQRGNANVPPFITPRPPGQIPNPFPNDLPPPPSGGTGVPPLVTPPVVAPVDLPPTSTIVQPANFMIAAQKALIAEGGYQNNPNDAGNWTGGSVGSGQNIGTNRGIIPRTYKAFYGRFPTVAEMQALTQNQALQIYKALFWDKIRGDEILNQPLANIIFDGQLQHGKNVRILQTAVNALGYAPALSTDNKFGNKTLAAINYFATTNPAALYLKYKQKRIDYYYYLVTLDARNANFINGWMYRINKFNAYA